MNMIARFVKALPRAQLDSLATDYGNDRPWQSDRKTLEGQIISMDGKALREEVVDIVRRLLLP